MRFSMLLTSLAAAALLCPAQPFVIMEKPPDWVEVVEHNIPYGRYPQTVLDIMRKKGPEAAGKRPGVLVIHGGGWIAQRKERNVAGFCLPFLERGFVAANVEYRLAEVATAPAAVTDVLEAAAWFHKHAGRYGVDPNKIVVIGESAGAHLALMVGMTPRSAHLGPATRVAAVVDVFGISDVAPLVAGPEAVKSAQQWIPDQPNRLELARRVSPLTYVRPGLPPILIIHGDRDGSVPYPQATMLEKALRERGVDTELITVPNGNHGFPVETWNRLLPKVFDFLARRGIIPLSPSYRAGTRPGSVPNTMYARRIHLSP